MTSRDLAPLSLHRIGRVTDALSLRLGMKSTRQLYSGGGYKRTSRGEGVGRGISEGLPPQHCCDWAGSACGISRLRQRGKERIRTASRCNIIPSDGQTDPPIDGIFFSLSPSLLRLSRCLFRRSASEREITMVREKGRGVSIDLTTEAIAK